MVKLWPLWIGLAFIGIYAALYYGGWINAAAAFVVALVLAPALLFAPPWGYVNFELGGFALFGANKTYFGQSAAGSSIAYFKVIGSF